MANSVSDTTAGHEVGLRRVEQCPVCQDLFYELRILPSCRHRHCDKCLANIIRSSPVCSMCREAIVIQVNDISDLPTSAYFERLIESDDRCTEWPKPRSKTAKPVACNWCAGQTKQPAIVACAECREYLCVDCTGIHARARLTSSHRVDHDIETRAHASETGATKNDISRLESFVRDYAAAPQNIQTAADQISHQVVDEHGALRRMLDQNRDDLLTELTTSIATVTRQTTLHPLMLRCLVQYCSTQHSENVDRRIGTLLIERIGSDGCHLPIATPAQLPHLKIAGVRIATNCCSNGNLIGILRTGSPSNTDDQRGIQCELAAEKASLIEVLQLQLDDARGEAEKANYKSSDMEKLMTESEEANAKLRAEKNQMAEKLEAYITEIRELNEQLGAECETDQRVCKLSADLDVAFVENQRLAANVQQRYRQIRELNDDLLVAARTAAELKQRVDDETRNGQHQHDESERLRRELGDIRAHRDELVEMISNRQDEYKSGIAALNERIACLTEERTRHKHALEIAEERIRQSDGELRSCNEQLRRTHDLVDTYVRQLAASQVREDEADQRACKLGADLDVASFDNQRLWTKNQKLDRELADTVDQLKRTTSSAAAVEQRLSAAVQRMSRLQADNDQLRDQLDAVAGELDKSRVGQSEEQATLDAEQNEYKRHIATLAEQLACLTEERRRNLRTIDVANERIRQLVGEVERLTKARLLPRAGRVFDIPGIVPVYGVTSLADELFLVRMDKAVVEVYGAESFRLLRQIAVKDLLNATDMAACSALPRCLYIADSRPTRKVVHCVDLDAAAQTSSSCWPVGDTPGALSVTPVEHHVLVTCTDSNALRRFTSDGQLVRELVLDREELADVRHAVQLVTGRLVVCHGRRPQTAPRVCLLTVDGRCVVAVSAFDVQWDWPTHLAVDADGFVYVADYDGKRVVVLRGGGDMACIGEIRSRQLASSCGGAGTASSGAPRRVRLDGDNRRLYVAECGGSVTVHSLQ